MTLSRFTRSTRACRARARSRTRRPGTMSCAALQRSDCRSWVVRPGGGFLSAPASSRPARSQSICDGYQSSDRPCTRRPTRHDQALVELPSRYERWTAGMVTELSLHCSRCRRDPDARRWDTLKTRYEDSLYCLDIREPGFRAIHSVRYHRGQSISTRR